VKTTEEVFEALVERNLKGNGLMNKCEIDEFRRDFYTALHRERNGRKGKTHYLTQKEKLSAVKDEIGRRNQ